MKLRRPEIFIVSARGATRACGIQAGQAACALDPERDFGRHSILFEGTTLGCCDVRDHRGGGGNRVSL